MKIVITNDDRTLFAEAEIDETNYLSFLELESDHVDHPDVVDLIEDIKAAARKVSVREEMIAEEERDKRERRLEARAMALSVSNA